MNTLESIERRVSNWWPILLSLVGALVGVGSTFALAKATDERQDTTIAQIRAELKTLSDDTRLTRETVIRIETKLQSSHKL